MSKTVHKILLFFTRGGHYLNGFWLICMAIILNTACSAVSTLSDNERLYKGHSIKIEDKEFMEQIGLKSALNKAIQPKPNDRLFGLLPFKLWIYNLFGDSVPEKGLRNWMQEKLGQPPTIYREYFVDRSENNIRDFLYSRGYFDASAGSEITADGKKVHVTYFITTNDQYALDTIVFPEVTDTLTKFINLSKDQSLIKEGDPYNLERFKDERQRINEFLKNYGYYYFAADHLIFEVDSNARKKEIDVYLRIKSNTPKRAKQRYAIGNIYIDSDHTLVKGQGKKDTMMVDSMYFIYRNRNVKPNIITRSIMFDKGGLYNYDKHTSTLNKLTGLGVFKFSNIGFKLVSPGSNLLNANIALTQSVPKSVRAEIQAVTRSNNNLGPELSLSYRDRNFLGGAEFFSINVNTSFQTQLSNMDNTGNAYEAGVNTNLSVPRFLFPFVDLNKYLSRKYTPKTNIRAGYRFNWRTRYFMLNTFNILYGYSWRETSTKSHEIELLNGSYSRLSATTAEFDTIRDNNPLVLQSFSEELKLGLAYSFIYNNQLQQDKPVNTYFRINAEFAGNSFGLYHLITTGQMPSSDNPSEILGVRYSQYVRFDVDYRLYIDAGDKSKMVTRLMAGIGSAYGNSGVLPWSRQFFVGGASDLRAFRTHTVGPGGYSPSESKEFTYFDQVGDIKLEANMEYRFHILRFFKGAFFIDAGNVWLLTGNDKPEGTFYWDEVIKQLAIGTGFGLRLDASVLVLRLDLGFPVRDPKLPEKDRWIFDEIDFTSANWRNNNLVLNIAIGYPF